MLVEIERKFLVVGDYKAHATSHTYIAQGYLCADGGRTVRVRVRDDRGYLTIKGPSHDGGLWRFEWEKEISSDEARLLLPLCLPGVVEKVRWLVPAGELTYEVDEFLRANAGLTVAEIELPAIDAPFERPEWLGREVTGHRRYYNAALTARPFCEWTPEEQAGHLD
jgi:adenylate cyclase